MTAAIASIARSFAVTIPRLRLVSEANRRDHHYAKARRVKAQRTAARSALIRATGTSPTGIAQGRLRWSGWEHLGKPAFLVVTIARVAPRKLDSDNLASSAKAVRDGVADWLGLDDGDERLDWQYEQRRGEPGEYAVEIRLEWDANLSAAPKSSKRQRVRRADEFEAK